MVIKLIPTEPGLYAITFADEKRTMPESLYMVSGAYSTGENNETLKPYGVKLGSIASRQDSRGEYTPLQRGDVFGQPYYLFNTDGEAPKVIKGAFVLFHAEDAAGVVNIAENYINHLYQIGDLLRAKDWF